MNEEIAVTEIITHSEHTNKKCLTYQALKYLNSLTSNNKIIPFNRLSENRQETPDSGIRDLLIGGRLWYEDKEQAPFCFPLHLPEKFLKRSAEVQGIHIPNLDSTLGNTLNVLRLIGLDEKSSAPKSRWKKACCIQTCLGLWAPRNWTEYISSSLMKQSSARKIWLDKVIKKFDEDSNEIHDILCAAYEATWTKIAEIEKTNSIDLRNRLGKKKLSENVTNWIKKINTKLATESFRKKILTGVSSVEMPDLWGANPSDANSFEETFFDHLEYEISRVSAGARNRSYIAKNLQSCLNEKKLKNTREYLVATFIESGNWILGNYDEEIISNASEEDSQEDDD